MNEVIAVAVKEAIKGEKVFWSVVTKLGRKSNGSPYMEVKVTGLKDKNDKLINGLIGQIDMDEVDAEIERKSLLPLLGHKVPFIVIGVLDEATGRLECSRKMAQMILKTRMAQDLANKKVFTGTVVNLAPYGVYIEVNGISGLLKNADYINIATPVSDYLSLGDTIDVFCKSIAENGKIQWSPKDKPESKEVSYDVVPDTVVLGTVINMKPFSSGGVGVFVRISKGLDALCLLPPDMELNPNDTVSVRIISVDQMNDKTLPPRVKGKILRLI